MLATRMRQAAAGAGGGLQFVGGTVGTQVGSDLTVSLTGLTGGLESAPAEGDIVIVIAAITTTTSGNIDMVINTVSYTELADLFADDDDNCNFGVFYKIMGASPDTSVVVDVASASFECSAAVHVWRGVDQSTPIDVTTTTATGISSGLANPPAITPVTSGAVILACGGSAPFNVRSLSHTLDNLFEENSSGVEGLPSAVGIASYSDWTSGAYNPDAFTLSGSDSTSASWAAATVALRPA